MEKGCFITCSVTKDSDNYSANLTYDDYDGISFEANAEGDDLEEIVYDLTEDVVETLTSLQEESNEEAEEPQDGESYIDYLEDKVDYLIYEIEQLTKENESLKIDNFVLQQRADDAVNKPNNDDKKVSDGFDTLIKPFYDHYLKYFL